MNNENEVQDGVVVEEIIGNFYDSQVKDDSEFEPETDLDEEKVEALRRMTSDIDIITDVDALHTVGKPIINDNLEEAYDCRKKLIKYLAQNENALGVAAQQVGYALRMFAMRYKDSILLIINPTMKMIKPAKYMISTQEECVSIPGKIYKKRRCKVIKTKFLDENMKWQEKRFTHFFATIFQHEFDHINGILISDNSKEALPKEILNEVEYKF